MSYTDRKITQEEINAHHVQGATDYLIGNAQQNKAVFDDLPEFIAGKFNDLIDEIAGQHGDEIRAAVDEWLAEHPEATTTVQDNSLTTAKYVDGSVTEPKIAERAVTPSKLDRAYSTPDDLASVNANLTNELNVLDSRMDEFASLPPGSTSGNAELLDIRVGADGETYQSAGDAVRGQAADLKSDFKYRNKEGYFDMSSMIKGKFIYSDGDVVANSDHWYSDYFPVKPGDTFEYRLAAGGGGQIFTFATYAQKDWHSKINLGPAGEGYGTPLTGTYTVQAGENFMRICSLIWDEGTDDQLANHVQGCFFRLVGTTDIAMPLISVGDLDVRGGFGINSSTGNLFTMDGSGYKVTPDYVPIEPKTGIEYALANSTGVSMIALYDRFKNYIRSIAIGNGASAPYIVKGSAVIDDNAYYARFSFFDTDIDYRLVTCNAKDLQLQQEKATKEELSSEILQTEDAILSIHNLIDTDSITWTSGFILASNGAKSSLGELGSDFVHVLPGMYIDYKLSCSPSFAVIAAYDKNKSFVRCVVEGNGYADEKIGTYIVESGIYYLRFSSCKNVAAYAGQYMRAYYPVMEKYKYRDVINHENVQAVHAITSARKVVFTSSIPSGTNYPLSLLHFTDIHGTKDSLKRIVDFKTANKDVIDDAICTGDMMVASVANAGMDFWDDVEGSEYIMMTTGNHDVFQTAESENPITLLEQYALYVEPYVSSWGVQYSQNKTWWYKDYANSMIRLIGLGTSAYGTILSSDLDEMIAWLNTTLSDAKTNGYSVVIAQHYLPGDALPMDCKFTVLDGFSIGGMNLNERIMESVDNFVANGGDFICHLCGHTHKDIVAYSETYPNQIFICGTTSSSNSLQQQFADIVYTPESKFADAFNVVTFDTNRHIMKIVRIGADVDMFMRKRDMMTINYLTKQIIE